MGEGGLTSGMTWAELARMTAALAEKLTGARLQKIRQPNELTIVLECRAPGETAHVLLSAHPRFHRLVLLTDQPRIASEASAFCGLLRKHLTGGRIVEIALEPNDRVVTFNVAKTDGEGQAAVWTLVAELFGAQANLLFLDPQGKLVEALIDRRLPSRGLRKQEVYLPPERSGAPGSVDRGLAVEEMAAAFAAAEATFEWEQVKFRGQNAIQRERRKTEKYLARLTAERDGLADPAAMTEKAELLVAHLRLVKRGQRRIELPSWTDPERLVAIELDPAKAPQANAEAMFKLARRNRRKREHLTELIEQAAATVARLTRAAAEMDGAQTPAAVQEVEQSLRAMGVAVERPKQAPPRRREEPSPWPKPFIAKDGSQIYVGRSDRENDELTFRLARGNDYWLHVHGGPGSHVVVKLPPGAELASETLLDAATLALLHSSQKSSGHGEVLYTRRKHVGKPRHAKAGLVYAADSKTIFVRLDDERLKRLYDSRS